MENTQEHLGRMEAQLKQWGARLDQIVAKANKVGTEVNDEKCQGVNELKAKYHAAQSKLVEYRAAGCEKWETFKAGLETTWSDLEAAFKKLKN